MAFTPTILDKPLTRFHAGWPRAPWAIVVHYSAGYDAEGCHNTLERRGLSVHATIERDGVIWRQVADENRTLHAGDGRWAGVTNMNHHSFGFEIVNLGWLDGVYEGDAVRTHNVFRPRPGTEINTMGDGTLYYRDEGNTRIITETKCAQVTDHRPSWKDKYWSIYPPEQMKAVFWLMWQWVRDFDILPENIIGHEHVSPGRKQDPGAHFPWKDWEAYLEERCRDEKPELLDPEHKKADRIRAVQSHCARMNLPVGALDGIWGPNTAAAVRRAVDTHGEMYGFSDVVVAEGNCYALANALRLVPG